MGTMVASSLEKGQRVLLQYPLVAACSLESARGMSFLTISGYRHASTPGEEHPWWSCWRLAPQAQDWCVCHAEVR